MYCEKTKITRQTKQTSAKKCAVVARKIKHKNDEKRELRVGVAGHNLGMVYVSAGVFGSLRHGGQHAVHRQTFRRS